MKIVILGSSGAIPDESHENTHFLIQGESQTVLVDCPPGAFLRVNKVGIGVEQITDLILTHFHPDHVSGISQFLMDYWLLGRRSPMNIYGLDDVLERFESMMDLFGWKKWPGFYTVTTHHLLENELETVLQNDEFRILSSPVKHFIPTIGLRIEPESSGKIIAYSCDTEPCPEVVRLSEGADILIHESTGAIPGHSSAEQAGRIARTAEVGALYLIHFPTGPRFSDDLILKAKQEFDGEIKLAEDFSVIDIK